MYKQFLRRSIWPVAVFILYGFSCLLIYYLSLAAGGDLEDMNDLYKIIDPIRWFGIIQVAMLLYWQKSKLLTMAIYAFLAFTVFRWYRQPTNMNGALLFLSYFFGSMPGYILFLSVF